MKEKKVKPEPISFTINSMANEYRPMTFDDVVGQDEAVATLRGMLARRQIPNAIMFTGGSGTGKTTLANIFARYVNCVTGDACGTCKSCSLPMNNHPDVTQKNAAICRGIDEIRKVIDEAKYRPRHNARFIIMDEAHQLTPQAVEAFLVPLEQPPAATMYILCTTDPQKFGDTLIKRCTRIPLGTPSKKSIATRLLSIAKAKKLKFSKDVLATMAEASEGCVREAINLLERAANMVAGNPKISDDKLIQTLSQSADADDTAAATALLIGMYAGKASAVAKAAFKVSNATQAINAAVFMNQYVIGVAVGDNGKNVWHSPNNKEFAKQLSKLDEKERSVKCMLRVHTRIVAMRNAMHNVPSTELSTMLANLT